MKTFRILVILCAALLAWSAAAAEPPTKARVLAIEGDQIVCNKPILFKTGSAEILPQSRSTLASVAATLETHLTIQLVEIGVHTDSQGSGTFNKRKSQERADAVRSALIKMGVKAKRLSAVGYGEERPIDTNRTAKGRAANRRVEFVIKTKQKGRAP